VLYKAHAWEVVFKKSKLHLQLAGRDDIHAGKSSRGEKNRKLALSISIRDSLSLKPLQKFFPKRKAVPQKCGVLHLLSDLNVLHDGLRRLASSCGAFRTSA